MPSRLQTNAAPYLPDAHNWRAMAEAVQTCRGCPLYANASQAVFGEGPVSASLMLVGEQPGDLEDRAGSPFVGPAGEVLDRALEKVGVDRRAVYVTNAVKHFKWKARGKRRVHEKPSWAEQMACKPWLEAELELIHPRVLVLLGATAAQTLLGKSFRVSRQHGEIADTGLAETVVATIHPSAVLRAEQREEMFGLLVADLRDARRALGH
jgi:DNA polymerase